jgi:hypothetical protein
MAKLNSNTVVTHPETGAPAVLLSGEDVPDWAEGLIGDHLIEDADEELEKPAGNASLEAWATYVLESDQASEDEIKGLTRDELRDKYGK